MKTFNKFLVVLLGIPDVKLSLKVPSIYGTTEETLYTVFLADASTWIKNIFAEMMQVDINNAKVIEAESAKNLAQLFDILEIKTWATNNKTPQPTGEKTKARVTKTFLYALQKNGYDIYPVLETYLHLEKERDYVSLFMQYLQEIGEGDIFNKSLTPKEEMVEEGKQFTAIVEVIEHLVAKGRGPTKDAARQNACKEFLQINMIK